MKQLNKILLMVLLFIFISPFSALAEGEADKSSQSSVYLFHLYYDNGQLFADRDFKYQYNILNEEFAAETYTTTNPYKGEIINFKNQIKATFRFDPQRGNPNFTKGKISVKAPYFADADKVNFYNSQNNLLLTISVSGSSFCDNNGICDSDVGESSANCPSDCKVLPVSPTPSPSAAPALPTGKNFIYAIIYLIIGIGAAIIGWVLWRRWRRKNEEVNINQ